VPLTTFPGNEGRPTFSPDGKQVAFTWNGQKEDNFDIYVKLVGETNALRLTTDAAPESFPAWSPDGKRIAFRRSQQDASGSWSSGIWLVSPLGGAAQKLTDLQTLGFMSWSPDGRWLAVGLPRGARDARGIVLVPVDGGEPRRVSTRQAPAFDVHPSFSPDGRLLAYASCTSGYFCDVFVQQLDSGYAPREAPRRITQQGFLLSGLAWSRDGESLVYGGSWSWGLSPRLWRVGSRGDRQPERIDLAGFQASDPSVAPAGDRLVFGRSTSNFDVWRYQVGGVPEPFLKSSVGDYSAHFSPDGSRIAFSSDRSGDVIEMWTVGADGSNPVQVTRGPGRGQATNRWSPDGRLIAFDSLEQDGGSKVYVVDASGGRPRRVSSETADEYNPSWSRDGKRIYFFSSRTGRNEIWRTALGEGVAERVTENGGYVAFESTDGRTLFYTKAESSQLFARSLDGGPERQVLEGVTESAFAVFEDGIYFIGRLDAEKRYPLKFYEFSTRSSRLLTRTEGPLAPFLSVSPDRKTFLFTRSATEGTDLMLIENFR
jgi:Tol biopolymer transport system component